MDGTIIGLFVIGGAVIVVEHVLFWGVITLTALGFLYWALPEGW